MSLTEYKRKRDFKSTPEPSSKKSPKHKLPIFVIQEHHASTHHFDFRLEAAGVLKSWAVPKGPSMSPADKRLAIQVEDHPLSYATFAGDIPPGHYGAGHVEIFDQGTYTPDSPVLPALKKGHLTFSLQGKKLQGSFTLLRTPRPSRQPQWLLIKRPDEYAQPHPSRPSQKSSPPLASSRISPPLDVRRSKLDVQRSSPSKILTSKSPHKPIELTHPEKLLYPDAKLTKQDISDYYRRVAHVLLPHLRNRPITLERFPAGVGADSPRFWQKNLPKESPSWIPRIELPSEAGKPVHYPLINDLDTLLYFVNQNALTFHIYLSTIDHLDQPDFILFDLDPGSSPFKNVITLAKSLHQILNTQNLPNYLKTTGNSGLHILAKPKTPIDYDSARTLAESIAQQLVTEHPTLATTERSLSKRKGRIYIDTAQNALGHHLVAPYSLRPTPTATVSTPLDWKELTAKLTPQKFTAQSLPKCLSTKDDPMLLLLD